MFLERFFGRTAVSAQASAAPQAPAAVPPTAPVRRSSNEAGTAKQAAATAATRAHWGMEFDGLDFWETLVPGPLPSPHQ
ncbi:hypothetical protein D9Q98_002465 [Chlorella vulgaris]|uniref:Uncharacterized protein n=1 Tax=Chlorella vulgaris TaxID=3077 RepID=A0A9D4TTE2_CHLVU|nr:hypothetical protein D9Q98_002465 [Chlorella vulgaris]